MNTYDIIVPLGSSYYEKEDRQSCLVLLRQCKIRRILLILNPLSDGVYNGLADDIAFFTENGMEVMVWLGEILGHGVALAGQKLSENKLPYMRITGIMDKSEAFAFCPLDPKFQEFFLENVRTIVKAGAQGILLDDDFRLSNRAYGVGCGCKRHKERIYSIIGRQIDDETMERQVFHGCGNAVRDAWYQVQGDSMREFSAKIRETVNEINPAVRVGLCSGQTSWDTDGTNAEEIAEILAGDTKPFLRLPGAPYWAWRKNPEMTGVFEIISMCLSFCHNPNAEIVAEGDVYPRPRYHCPASYLELFDAFVRADGQCTGNMKYMLDYVSSPNYETGYFKYHMHMLPQAENLQDFLREGSRTGVRVYETNQKFRQADLPGNDFESATICSMPYPHGGCMLAACGVPTTYSGNGLCGIAFGENARYLESSAWEKGLILDASAARILSERGIDVGICRERNFSKTQPDTEYFGKNAVRIEPCDIRYLEAELDSSVTVESTVDLGEKRFPLSYRYENQTGQRFLVFLFDSLELPRNSGWLFSYERQEQLYGAIEWLSGEALPAFIPHNPFLYQLMKKEGDTIRLGFFNCFADTAISPHLILGKNYHADDYCMTAGKEADGEIILEDIAPYSFIGISIKTNVAQ